MAKRKRIPVTSEVSCETCPPSPCCKGPTWIDLDRKELGFMVRGGNELTPIALIEDKDRVVATPVAISAKTGRAKALPDVVPAGKGRFIMLSDCAYLATDDAGNTSCSAYEERPLACAKYEVNGVACLVARQLFDVDPVIPGGDAATLIEAREELDKPVGFY